MEARVFREKQTENIEKCFKTSARLPSGPASRLSPSSPYLSLIQKVACFCALRLLLNFEANWLRFVYEGSSDHERIRADAEPGTHLQGFHFCQRLLRLRTTGEDDPSPSESLSPHCPGIRGIFATSYK